MTEQHECEWVFSIYFPHVSCKCGETISTKEADSRLNEYETLKAALDVAMSENQRLTKIVETTKQRRSDESE